VVFAIAAGVVGREAHRLDAAPARPVFDPDEATAWIAEQLPTHVTAVLSYDDVRRIVEWTLAFLASRRAVSNGSAPDAGEAVVVGGPEAVAYVLSEAAAAGVALTAPQAHAVIEAQLAYLEAIGAVGPEAGP